jgi:hypothetical protein
MYEYVGIAIGIMLLAYVAYKYLVASVVSWFVCMAIDKLFETHNISMGRIGR